MAKEIEVKLDTEIQSGRPYTRAVTIQLDKHARPNHSAVYDVVTKELIPNLVSIDIHMTAGDFTTATLTSHVEGLYTEDDRYDIEYVGVVGFTTERW